MEALDEWSQAYLQDILEGNVCTDQGDIDAALKDFASGKAMVVEYLREKLRCWDSLPWRLAALNRGDAAARKIASEAIEAFDKRVEVDGVNELHHRLTLKVLKHGSQERQEIEAFSNGTELAELPALRSFIWSLRFIPTVERVQERDHATTKRLVSHRGRITGPYVSLRLRFEELRPLIDLPAEFQEYLECFEEIASPDDLAKRMGFSNHWLWMEAVAKKYTSRLKFGIAASILYSMDPATQFAKVQKARENRSKRKKEKEQRVRAALKKIEPKENNRWSPEGVERLAMAEHLQ